MRKSKRYQIGLAVAAVVVAGLLFHFGTPKPGESQFGQDATVVDASDLDFKKSLLFTSDSMIKDDEEPQMLPCKAEPQVFAYLKLDPDVTAELTCSSDYLGGVKLQYRLPGSEEYNALELGQREADAGDLWDIRSLVSRNLQGRLVIETLVLSSSENEEDSKQPASCSIRQEAVIWDASVHSFMPHNQPSEFFLPRFAAPINVVNDCLDAQGNWRGQATK